MADPTIENAAAALAAKKSLMDKVDEAVNGAAPAAVATAAAPATTLDLDALKAQGDAAKAAQVAATFREVPISNGQGAVYYASPDHEDAALLRQFGAHETTDNNLPVLALPARGALNERFKEALTAARAARAAKAAEDAAAAGAK